MKTREKIEAALVLAEGDFKRIFGIDYEDADEYTHAPNVGVWLKEDCLFYQDADLKLSTLKEAADNFIDYMISLYNNLAKSKAEKTGVVELENGLRYDVDVIKTLVSDPDEAGDYVLSVEIEGVELVTPHANYLISG